jgi:hypothetical protein
MKMADAQPAARDTLTRAREAADVLLSVPSPVGLPGFVDLPEGEWNRCAAGVASLRANAAEAARAASCLEECCDALLKLGLSLAGTEMQIEATATTSEQCEGRDLLEAGGVMFADDARSISRTARLLETLAGRIARNASDLTENGNSRSQPGNGRA